MPEPIEPAPGAWAICRRCGSIVWDAARHERWHGSVDSNAKLPEDGPDA